MPTLTTTTGETISYTDQGRGPVVVLLRTDARGTWERSGIAPALRADEFRTLTLDLPPDAAAAVQGEDLSALLDAVGAERVALVGYAEGALAALRLAGAEVRVAVLVLAAAGDRIVPAGGGEPDPASVPVPTLVVAGDFDEEAGDPHALAHRFPQGEGHIIAGDHHAAVLDPSFAGTVVTFVAAHLHADHVDPA